MRPLLPWALWPLLWACSPAPSEPAQPPPPPEPAEPVPDDPIDRVVHEMGGKYAAGMIADGSYLRSELGEGQKQDHLVVLKFDRCYRFLAAGGPDVVDMDLFLFDPNGVQVQQDASQDRYPVLGLSRELCPAFNGAYRVQVVMFKGEGPYSLRTYRSDT